VGVKWTCQRDRLANQRRISLVLWLDALSMTTRMSRSVGTLRSISSRNLRNSGRGDAACNDDRSCLHVESGKQRRGAVALLVVGTTLNLAGSHGQQRLRAIQRLDLALFIDAKH